LASPNTGEKTVVIGTDDSTPGQVYVYVGEKRGGGNAVERAGLTGGDLWGVRASFDFRPNASPGQSAFLLENLGDVSGKTGAQPPDGQHRGGHHRVRPSGGRCLGHAGPEPLLLRHYGTADAPDAALGRSTSSTWPGRTSAAR
jgi:hypothetical protein